MAKITDILRTMEYGPSPESDEHVRAWLAAHRDGFGHFIAGRFARARRALRREQSRDAASASPRVTQGHGGGRRRRGRSRAQGAGEMVGA